MNRISEADLERIRELLKVDVKDELAARAWIEKVKTDLESLVEDATDRFKAHGGEFAERLRAALEAKILTEVNGRAVLTKSTRELSLNVAVTKLGVYVDVRLELGVGA